MDTALPDNKKTFDSAFADLARVHKALILEKDSTVSIRDLQQALGVLTESVTSTIENEHAKTILPYWMDYFALLIESGKLTAINEKFYHMRVVLSMLGNNGLVNEYAANEDTRKTLAWICLICTAQCEDWPVNRTRDYIGQVFTQWIGNPDAAQAALSLAASVKLLYGPGVWELYGMDVEASLDLPGHLYQQGLIPLQPCSLTVRPVSEQRVTLPNDLGI